jgi:hypothetical protein
MKQAACPAMFLAMLLLGCSSKAAGIVAHAGGTNASSGGASGNGGANGGTSGDGSGGSLGGSPANGGSATGAGGKADAADGSGGTVSLGGRISSGGTVGSGGTRSAGGGSGFGGAASGGAASGDSGSGGAGSGGSGSGGKTTISISGGSLGSGGIAATGGTTVATGSGPVGVFSGALATGIAFTDTDGKPVNAHGGGIVKGGDTFYLHGLYFPPGPTPNDFNGVAMYSSKDLATWKNEGIILPQQPSGQLGPNRNCDRPHIIKCPGTGEFVLTARASDDVTFEQDREVVYATSPTVNAVYTFKGSLLNASGQTASHSDMSAYADETGAYFITESGWVYTLAADCHSWVSGKQYSAVNGSSGGGEAPTVFKVDSTYYWIMSYKTGWRCNNNFYSTAPAMSGPWTYQGYLAPVTDPSNDISDQRTWLSQTTWVQPVVGSKGTVYVYWGDHWNNCGSTSGAGSQNYLATYVFQPLIPGATKTLLPTYLTTWSLDVGAGTWSQ